MGKKVEAQTGKAAIAKARAQSLQIESIGALTFWRSMIFSESRFPPRIKSGAGFSGSHAPVIAQGRAPAFLPASIGHAAVWLRGTLAQ
jgi:hypothetical protein